MNIQQLFTKHPFTYSLEGVNRQLSTRAKVTVIAVAVLAGLFTLGIGAPFAFFAAAYVLRGRKVQQISPQNGLYTPKVVEGGKLYYKGNVPVLELEHCDDARKRGKIHGELIAPYLAKVYQKLIADHAIPENFDRHEMQALEAKIPQEYLDEMDGFCESYNAWAQTVKNAPKGLTRQQMIAVHLIGDSIHYKLPGAANNGVGCSVVVQEKNEDLVCGRNLDWNSHDVFGSYSLVQVYKQKNGDALVSVAFPGLLGVTSAIRLNRDEESGPLALFMNVCAGVTGKANGLVAMFNNRRLLESSKTVDEVKANILTDAPLGPYHATVVTKKSAASIHFKQASDGSHYIRDKKSGKPLIVTNWRYSPEGNAVDIMNSGQREELIRRHLRENDVSTSKRVKKAIRAPLVNNALTLQSMYFNPQKRTLKVAFANSNAGSKRMQKLDLKEFL